MHVTYEVRTSRGAPVFSFDSLSRAKEELERAKKRIKCNLKIVKVTHI